MMMITTTTTVAVMMIMNDCSNDNDDNDVCIYVCTHMCMCVGRTRPLSRPLLWNHSGQWRTEGKQRGRVTPGGTFAGATK